MQNKRRGLKPWFTACIVFILVCLCFFPVGRTTAYISDLSNTCENVFVGVTESETQPSKTTEPSEKTTVYRDTGITSPPTHAENTELIAAVACLIFSGLLILISSKRKK